MTRPLEVPLFPLPHVVLLPGAVMSFHLFEARYIEMIEHVMRKSEPLIAVSKLMPCTEVDYFLSPEFEHWGSIGEVVVHRKNDNATHDVLLMGVERAQLREAPSSDRRLYRCVLAYPTPLPELPDYHREWLVENEPTLGERLSRDSNGELTRELYKKWRDGFITARALLHVFVHTIEKDSERLQQVLLDEGGDLPMEILKGWLRRKRE